VDSGSDSNEESHDDDNDSVDEIDIEEIDIEDDLGEFMPKISCMYWKGH